MTIVIAHRGASKAAPENTIAAFEQALAIGADAVELDVRRSADDRLVVHHDPVLADGRPIRGTPAGEMDVPTLDAALDACAGIVVNIEIKNDPSEPDFDPSEWVAYAVAAHLARRGGGGRWLISSFRRATVDASRSAGVRTARLVVDPSPEVLVATAAAGHHAIHPWVDRVDQELIRRAHGLGLAVNTWTCDDPERIAELIAWGVDGICTNVPDVALAVRRSVRPG